MIRPPDPRNFVHAKHFEGRRRRFELQVQIQFKKIPKGKVFMGGQLREPMTLGFIMRSIGMTLLSVVKTLVPGGGKLHHSFGSSSERPHIAFPFRQAVAAMVISKENEKAPVLGGDIVESPCSEKTTKKRCSSRMESDGHVRFLLLPHSRTQTTTSKQTQVHIRNAHTVRRSVHISCRGPRIR